MTKSSRVVSEDAISAFWRWFSTHHSEVEALLDRDQTAELSGQMNAQMDMLLPQLAWEIGPGLVEPYMFVLPAGGDSSLKAVVSRIMEKAPKIDRWEFHASRPTRPFQAEVRLPDADVSFKTSDWRFTLEPSANSDRFDLKIFDETLAGFDQKLALTAVFVLLDAVPGGGHGRAVDRQD